MIINPYVFGGPALDPDAAAFLTAAAITDPTITSAINTLVLDMKGYGIWTKMKAIYPFVGGTATTHKWNLKNPLDTDAAFRLNFLGGWTHNSNGVQANGTNGYANTFFNSSINSSINNGTIGVYTRNASIPLGSAFGALNSSFFGTSLAIKFSGDNRCYYSLNDDLSQGLFINTQILTGLWSSTINSANVNAKRIYRNSIFISGINRGSNTLYNGNIAFSARNVDGTIGSYDNSNFAFFYIADTLTAIEIGNFYTAVQAFQTTLGRQV